MNSAAVRETAAPWYIKQAEFDGIIVVLSDDEICSNHGIPPTRYGVAWGKLPLVECGACAFVHVVNGGGEDVDAESLEEAEVAYSKLERMLLEGELQ